MPQPDMTGRPEGRKEGSSFSKSLLCSGWVDHGLCDPQFPVGQLKPLKLAQNSLTVPGPVPLYSREGWPACPSFKGAPGSRGGPREPHKMITYQGSWAS